MTRLVLSKQNENWQEGSKMKYQFLAERVCQPFAVIDPENMKHVYCNSSVKKLLGYKDYEIIGTTFGDQISSWSKELAVDIIREELSKNKTNNKGRCGNRKFEMELIHKNGSSIWSKITAIFLKDYNGKMMVMLAARDITEQKEKEKENQMFQALLDQSSDAFFVIEPNTGTFLYANDGASFQLGFKKNELVNKKSVVDIDMSMPDNRSWQKHFIKLQKKGCIIRQGNYRRKDSSKILVEVNDKVVYRNDNDYIVSTTRDISERKQAKLALLKGEARLEKEKNKLEKANVALNVLLDKLRKDRREIESNILINIETLILPLVGKLKENGLNDRQKSYASLLENNIREITSNFGVKLAIEYSSVTPTEIEVVDFVRQGKTIKEIAEIMCLSPRTIETHRYNIRKKLGLNTRKENLRSFLLSKQSADL